MATLLTMELVGLGSLTVALPSPFFNKAMTGDARNGAARLVWFFVGAAFGLYAYGAFGGMKTREEGVPEAQ
ncbi:hypothetical protein ACQVBX_15245 [Dyella sp. KULCS107]|uniref:hypothetical protein n=1 Tax=Dyella sp. KULCS107 TaxID=3422216 RepID=UPI003D6FF50E